MSDTPISIALPRSKSIVIRCLIVQYLKTGKLLPVFKNDPNDIKIVYNALKKIESSKKSNAALQSEIVIDVEDCGAAYRFLMAVLATTKGRWLLRGYQRLLQRPIQPLASFLIEQGAIIQNTESGWIIEGRELQIDDFEIDSSETSQFASAIMMVRELITEKGKKQKTESRKENPYILMTQSIINQFDDFMNMVKLADWSAAAFWIAHALLTPNAHYLLKDLHFDGLQGDAEIVPWFEKWGVSFIENKKGIEVKHTQQISIPEQQIDVAKTPDIAMILAVLAVCYPFQLTLTGLKNINLKESNRLDILVKELTKFTSIIVQSENKIIIHKRKKELPLLFNFDSYQDHRFVMAWSLFKKFGEVKIKDEQCVKKSYPGFCSKG